MKQNNGKGCDGRTRGAVSGRGVREGLSEKAAFGQKLE